MKALVVRQFGVADGHSIEELPTPVPGSDEVLVEVRAAGVNFPDLLVVGGTYQVLPPLPFTPGKECAGIVRAAGPNAARFKPGDRVMVQVEYGAFTQQMAAKQKHCHLMPDGMSFPVAGAMGVTYLTAYLALVERAALKRGETVLVTGAAGGVGLAAVQVARALGATVLAAVSSPEKAAAATASGAHHIIQVKVPDLRDSLREQVHAAVGRRGVDVILDNVGGDVFDAALRAIAWSGRLLVIGFASGRVPEIKAGTILVKNISIIGFNTRDYRDDHPEQFAAARQRLLDMWAAGELSPRISATFPLERYAEAMALIKNRNVIGKVVLTMDGRQA